MPTPLHPAIVHMPVALVVLLPLFAFGALWFIHRGASPLRAWGVTVGLMAMLLVSAFVAVQTGQAQEDKVERIVSERALEHHEEAGEAFLWFAAAALVIGVAGLAGGRFGRVARVVGAVGTVALLGAGINVGRSGGELVYRHGAASAYATPGAGGGEGAQPAGERDESD